MKVTAIITTYNSENCIERTINSILNQKHADVEFDLEIIVVDDHSLDKTREIVESFSSVQFIQNHKNSGGPNKGRNIGLNMATGDYICIVDHDDEWMPDKISKQLHYALKGFKIVTSNYIQVNEINKTNSLKGNKSTSGFTSYTEDETFMNKLAKNKTGEMAYIGSILFHSSLKTVQFEEEYGMVDFDWLLRLFRNNCSVEINEPLYIRHFDGTNLSLNETYRENDYHFSIQTVLRYKIEFPKLRNIALQRINGSYARYYYVSNKMKLARRHFLKSEFNFKIILYFLPFISLISYKLLRLVLIHYII